MGLAKVLITSKQGPSVSLTAQFNPKELEISKTVSWTNAQGASSEDPTQEFKEPQSSTLSATLYFDTYETKENVYTKYISKLEKLVTIEPSLGHPPLTLFTWGSLTFQGVVESLGQKYTMFLEDGTRCRCEVAFKMRSASGAISSTKPKQ